MNLGLAMHRFNSELLALMYELKELSNYYDERTPHKENEAECLDTASDYVRYAREQLKLVRRTLENE